VIFMKTGRLTRATLLLLVFAGDAQAATLDGAAMKWPFALPFAGLLLSIAIGPLLFPRLWHSHYGKIAAAWSVLTLALLSWFAGGSAMLAALTHAMLGGYLSFIVLLFALYVVAGGRQISWWLRSRWSAGSRCRASLHTGCWPAPS